MLVCYQLIHRTVIFKVRAANTGSLVYSPASLSLSSCSRPDSVLTVCVVESVLHVWDIWVMCLELSPTPNNNWVTLRMNAANPSVLSVYMLSNAMMRRVLWRSITWAAAACSSQGRKWKDLHPSVQMWVRERSLENWERAGEREREETENELFHLRVGVEKARVDSMDDVYSWGAKDGGYGGVKGPPVWVSVYRQRAGCMSALFWVLLKTKGILYLSYCNNTTDTLIVTLLELYYNSWQFPMPFLNRVNKIHHWKPHCLNYKVFVWVSQRWWLTSGWLQPLSVSGTLTL